MTVWITSIAAVIAFTVLVDVLLPEGQISKYVKGVLAVLTVTVVVSPLPSLFSSLLSAKTSNEALAVVAELPGGIDDATASAGADVASSSQFLSAVNEKRLAELAASTREYLLENGCDVELALYSENCLLLGVQKVEVFCNFSEISEEEQHIFMTKVRALLNRKLAVSESDVTFSMEANYG